MADEATFLALLRDNPDDLHARLVYADWLEEHGDPRAALLREQVALSQLAFDTDRVVERGRALLATRATLAGAWPAIIHPPLAGTCWATKSHANEAALVGFLADGKLVFRRASGQWGGTWSQLGNAVEFTINDYSPHEGIFYGDRMRGDAWNKGDQVWTWGALRIEPATLTAEPFPEVPADTPLDTEYTRVAKPKPKRTRTRATPEPPATPKPRSSGKR